MIGQAIAPTAPPPRSARDRVKQDNQGVNSTPNQHQPRFFVQMGWSRYEVDSQAIINGYLLRGEITPCRSYQAKDSIHCLPEGLRIEGSEERDPSTSDRAIVWAKYWKYAQNEGERLVAIEQSYDQSRKMGLVEITSLGGFRSELYDRFDFNQIFYPDGLENLPVKNEEMEAHLMARNLKIQAMDLPAELKPVLASIGNELLDAVRLANRIQSDRIDFTHRCMQLSPEDKSGYFKKAYDVLDEEMLTRTGKPRVGEALEVQAKALHILAEDKAAGRHDDPFAALAKAQSEQNEILRQQLQLQADQNRQLMDLVMANQQSAKVNQEAEKIEKADVALPPMPQTKAPNLAGGKR